ncbi:hypothetical protein BGZ92_004433 [Podila epicladia]|nr:hypothetical protein BGZ92_004433 [Podila epicladia]
MARAMEHTKDHADRILYPSMSKDKDSNLPINNNKKHHNNFHIRMLVTTPIVYILRVLNPTLICQQRILLSRRTRTRISTHKRLRRLKNINTIISIFLITQCGDGHMGRPRRRRDVDHNGRRSPERNQVVTTIHLETGNNNKNNNDNK